MPEVSVDHVIIHVDDWDAANRFYGTVLGAEVVANPEGAANPLGAWVYRLGGCQINVHGPWPGMAVPCCPPPLDEVGRADLAFATSRSAQENLDWLAANDVAVESGPMRRFGASGWGTSVYCRDPAGNGVELIAYDDQPTPAG